MRPGQNILAEIGTDMSVFTSAAHCVRLVGGHARATTRPLASAATWAF